MFLALDAWPREMPYVGPWENCAVAIADRAAEDGRKLTHAQLGVILGVSDETIRRDERSALAKLVLRLG